MMVSHTDSVRPPSRREMLYYLGGASLGLLAVGSCGVSAWYIALRRVPGTYWDSGLVHFTPEPLFAEQAPIFVVEAQTYLVPLESGLIALHAQCVFRDHLQVKWQTERFPCRGCGTQYRRDGGWIAGPGRRGLDRFWMEIETPDGTFQTPDDGAPIPFEGATSILIDTKRVIAGAAHP
jgi:hypothetical protein